VIVGAGSAGCVLANRLSEDPDCRVLLLEAGGEAATRLADVPGAAWRLQDTSLDWGFRTTPQQHLYGRQLPYARGRVVGGSSVLNYLIYIRGNSGDYNHWRQLGNAGWAYDDVLPYFRRAENNAARSDAFHGAQGPLHVESQRGAAPINEIFIQAAQSVGIPYNPDFNGEAQEGCGYYQVTARGGVRCSASAAYLDPIRARPNLTIAPRALVLRLAIENGRAIGVDYFADGRSVMRATADGEVILAAGAIGSPHLMMLSGLGPAADLMRHGVAVVADLPGVGQDLQDHLGGIDIRASVRDPEAAYGAGPGSFDSCLEQFERDGGGPLATNQVEAGGFFRADPGDEHPSVQMFFIPGTADFYRSDGVSNRNHFHLGLNVLRPRSRGSVTLASADPVDRPLIDPNFLADPDDLRLNIAGLRRNCEIIRARPFDGVRDAIFPDAPSMSDADLAAHIRRSGGTTWHPTSTCRMGSDARAVVDADLRVRGVSALRICDASVMPTLVSGNTNAPTIMIAEKGADLIRGRVRKSSGIISTARP
jgi:choline dehydrogenase